MRRTFTAGFALALSFTALAGSVLAQGTDELAPPLATAEPTPTPSGAPTGRSGSEPSAGIVLPESLTFVEPAWRRITPGRSPGPREDHTWTVDGEGRFAYLFGGRDGEREFGDLWRFDLRRDRWKKLAPDGRLPAPRFGHSAVWVDGQGLVIFAGQRGTDFFDDLWVFDPEKGKWRKLPANGSAPRPRYGSCMVLGPDGRLWVSHGFTSAGRFDDTRAYNLRSRRWASLTPDGERPGERCLHECFTSSAGELVLYGGQDDGAFALGDLWSIGRAREWQRHADPRPVPRRLYGVTEAGDFAYIFGGADADDQPLSDLWRVDRTTLEFERVRLDGRHPSARYAGTLITDLERGRLLLFGGQGSEARADVWELVDRAPASESPAPVAPEGEHQGLVLPSGETATDDPGT